MRYDPVVDEVRRIRRAYYEEIGGNLRALAADLMKRERDHAERLVTLKPKPVEPRKIAS